MFDWFWEFLYGISKSILRLIDGLIACTNKLCGIETVNIRGTETDLVSYMLRSDALTNGFKIAAVLGFIVLVFFTIFRIFMVVLKEKPELSPIKVTGKAFKSLLLFLFVPVIMLTVVWALNTMMNALYTATMSGSQSLGTFLFRAFSADAEIHTQSIYDQIVEGYDLYVDTDLVAEAIELSDFDFIFSWIAGIAILFTLAGALIQFVDRAISIGVLFLVSPFSIASSVLDDGGRFKLWREQVLLKFLSGYGIIIYLNIYCLLISIISPSDVIFFDGEFVNNLFKLLVIIGGGFALQRGAALVGNLVGAGAGSRELMDSSLGRWGAAAAMGSLKLLGKGAWAGGKKLFGKKDKGKDDGKSKGDSDDKDKPDDKKEDDNKGDPFDKNTKYGDDKKVSDKLKNGSGSDDSKKNDKPSGGSGEGGSKNDNASGTPLGDGGKDVNKERGDAVKNALGGNNDNSINNVDDDDLDDLR